MGKAFVVNELAETWLLSILLVAQQGVNAGLVSLKPAARRGSEHIPARSASRPGTLRAEA